MAACIGVVRNGFYHSNKLYANFRGLESFEWQISKFNHRHISKLPDAVEKRAYLVDTLQLLKRLEAQGVPSKQAEAITLAISQVLQDNVAHNFVSKADNETFRSEIQISQESSIAIFKSEVQSSQGLRFSKLEREHEKIHTDIEKMRREMTYELQKAAAGQHLDMNLEKGNIREELATQKTETINLANKIDREIHALMAKLEAGKYDVIKYCVGTLVSVSAVGLAVLRILL